MLSRDNLKISFAVHTVWRVDDQRIPLFMERFSTTVTDGDTEKSPDAVVRVAYAHFIREPLRTYARDEVQRRNGLSVKDELIPIGQAVLARIRQYADTSPFIISSVVVGNVQYPSEVAGELTQPHHCIHPRRPDGGAADRCAPRPKSPGSSPSCVGAVTAQSDRRQPSWLPSGFVLTSRKGFP